MNIGFDLDGVLAKIDLKKYLSLQTAEKVAEYMENQVPYLNPNHVMADEDYAYIISGRSKDFLNITADWLAKHNFMHAVGIAFVGESPYKHHLEGDKWLTHQVLGKAHYIKKWAIEVYFEDNDDIVSLLRLACPGTKIIRVAGGRVEE
ncbi:MAG: hypothetical protein QME51_04355 [Planctomycetota bacterium]|nr:hypothetical protein [Planctomycetota bacterium]